MRKPLRTFVRELFPEDSVFLEELVIPERDTRIDIAVVNGALHGFEIKSDADTLKRLPTQRDSYNALFDEITLVVGQRHLSAAQKMVPLWWGLAVAVRTDTHVKLECHRVASMNADSDPAVVIKLLRRDEVERIVKEMRLCSHVSKYYVYELRKMIVAATDGGFLGSMVRTAIKQRHAVASPRRLNGG